MAYKTKAVFIRNKTAAEKFTDREEPQKAFWEKYNSLNVNNGEHDIIHYYGIGGIGKSTLLKKIRDDLIKKDNKGVLLYSFEKNTDKATFLFSLAKSISINYNAALPIFSYAYIKILNYQGFDGEEMIMRLKLDTSGVISSNTAGEVLKTAVTVVSDIVPIFGNTVGRFGEKAVDVFLEKVNEKRKNDMDDVAQRYMNEIDDATRYVDIVENLHEYLVYDSKKIMDTIDKPFVIMLDGYEYLSDNSRFIDNTYLNDLWLSGTATKTGLVHSLDNVIWVIAGREKLKWGLDEFDEEDAHLLGNLSEADTIEFFKKGVDPTGMGMSTELMNGLYKLTNGTPVYMDLCFDLFENGKGKQIEDFGKDTRDIAKRYLDNLDNASQLTMRFLCCLPKMWTEEMACAVSDSDVFKNKKYSVAVNSCIDSIKEHTFVEKIDDSYKLNQTIRDVVRDNTDEEEKNNIEYAVLRYLLQIMGDASQSIRNRVDLLRELNDYVSDYKVLSDDDLEIIKDTMEDYSGFIYSPEEGLLISERIYEALSERYGEGHPKTIEAVDEYAFALDNTDRKDQELDLWKEVQKKRAEILGGAHKHTLDALETIADILEGRGELEESLNLRREEYEECKKELGEDNDSTLTVLSMIAYMYRNMGDYSQATSILENIYEIKKRAFGEASSETLDALDELLSMLAENGKQEEVIKARERFYEESKNALGEDDKNTINSAFELARTYVEAEKPEKALVLMEQMYERRQVIIDGLLEEIKEKEQRIVDSTYHIEHLIDFLVDNGKTDKAIVVSEEVYEHIKQLLGEEHTDTLTALSQLAYMYDNYGSSEQAQKALEAVYEKRIRIQGDDNSDTSTALSDLSRFLIKMGEVERVFKINIEAYKRLKEISKDDYSDSLFAIREIACSLKKIEKNEESCSLLTEVYEKSKEIAGDEDDGTLQYLNDLTEVLMKIGKHEQALKLNEDAYDKLKSSLGEEHSETVAVLETIDSIRSAMGDKDKKEE